MRLCSNCLKTHRVENLFSEDNSRRRRLSVEKKLAYTNNFRSNKSFMLAEREKTSTDFIFFVQVSIWKHVCV